MLQQQLQRFPLPLSSGAPIAFIGIRGVRLLWQEFGKDSERTWREIFDGVKLVRSAQCEVCLAKLLP